MRNHLKLGDWNVACDVCGLKYKASQIKKRWDGLMVCSRDYEQRHPSDFLRIKTEKISVPFVRPDSAINYISYICSLYESQGLADIGSADCARADIRFPIGNQLSEDLFINGDTGLAIAGVAVAGVAISGKAYSLAPGV